MDDVEGCIKKLAKEPIYFDEESDCAILLKLKQQKLPLGIADILLAFPEFIQECPAASGATYDHRHTTSRMVLEFGGDGRFAALANACGYFSTSIEHEEGFTSGISRFSKLSLLEWLSANHGSPSIGVGLISIAGRSLDLWIGERAMSKVLDELTGLFFNFKLFLIPGSPIFISMDESEICQIGKRLLCKAAGDAGFATRRSGRYLILQTSSQSSQSQHPTLTWNTSANESEILSIGEQGLINLSRSILEKTPQAGVAMWLRSKASKRRRPLTFMEPLDTGSTPLPPLPDCSGKPEGVTRPSEAPALTNSFLIESSQSELIGYSPTHCHSPKTRSPG
jgi:hypothetical protein